MITDWLQNFLASLAESCPPADWPAIGTEAYDVFFEDWRKAFARHGISQAEAEEARSLMAEDPPRFKAQFLPKLLLAVRTLREVAGDTGRGGVAPGGRAMAELNSRGCCYCSGGGLTVVYASKPDPEKRISETSAAYCICPHGQWIERNHRENSPDVHARIPHLARVLANRSFWRLDPIWMTAAQGSRNPDPALSPPSTGPRPAAVVPARRMVEGLGKVEPAVPLPGKWQTTIDGEEAIP